SELEQDAQRLDYFLDQMSQFDEEGANGIRHLFDAGDDGVEHILEAADDDADASIDLVGDADDDVRNGRRRAFEPVPEVAPEVAQVHTIGISAGTCRGLDVRRSVLAGGPI